MKNFKKVQITIIFLLVISVVLVITVVASHSIEKLIPKKFPDFFKGPLIACSVSHVGDGTIHLNERQLKQFLACLENTEFYYEGSSGKILRGELYHVFLWGTDDTVNALEIIVSDEDFVYIGKKRYRTESIGESLAGLLCQVFAESG